MHSKGRSDTVALLHEAEQLELHQRIAQRRAMEPPDEAKLRLGPMLYEACKAGKLDDANKCIQDEADVTWADEKGRSSLWIACRMGRASCARLLLQSSALVDQIDQDGATPLIAACQYGKMDCVELLLDRGARINVLTKKGFTPLLTAIYNRQAAIAGLLIDRKAALEPKAQGKNALEWARTVQRAAPSEAAKQLIAKIEGIEKGEQEALQTIATTMAGPNGGGLGGGEKQPPQQQPMPIS